MRAKKNKLSFIFFCTLITMCAVLFSCSNNAPKIQEVYFQHYGSLKTNDERMVVFVNLESNFENISFMRIKHVTTGTTWELNNPEIIKDKKSNMYYCGSTNLVPEKEGTFLGGEYSVEYYDRAGRKTETQFFYISNTVKE